ncbi:Hsp70 family protein [Glycomyces buryatensis]|nr:Hsp70 family protein [Glycomyces buryatensis]
MQAVSLTPAADIDPEVAAARYTEAGGSELEPGQALVVYRLGSDLFDAAVIRSAGHRHFIASQRSAAIGGREFDALLLAFLSGRHRDADPTFWDRLDNPSDAADGRLRAGLSEKIRRARELLSKQDEAVVAVPEIGLALHLTREQVETCIRELVEQTVYLVEGVLNDVEPAGLLLAGGAARTPLVAAELRRSLGLEPLMATGPVHAVEETPTKAFDTLPEPGGPVPRRQRRILARTGAISVALVAIVAAVAAFGTGLGDDQVPVSDPAASEATGDGGAGASDSTETAPSTSPSPSESSSSAEESPSPSPEEEDEADAPASPESDPEDTTEPTTEAAETGRTPNVDGMQASDAGDEFADAGFHNISYVGEERGVFDFTYEDCEVIDQDPASGSEQPYDKKITVTYSYSSGDGSDCLD